MEVKLGLKSKHEWHVFSAPCIHMPSPKHTQRYLLIKDRQHGSEVKKGGIVMNAFSCNLLGKWTRAWKLSQLSSSKNGGEGRMKEMLHLLLKREKQGQQLLQRSCQPFRYQFTYDIEFAAFAKLSVNSKYFFAKWNSKNSMQNSSLLCVFSKTFYAVNIYYNELF